MPINSCFRTPLVRSEILGLFGNTLSADHMYSLHRLEKLMQMLQRLLSSKTENIFSNFYYVFGISTRFFSFWKKNQLHSLNIWQLIHPDKCGYLNVLEHPSTVNVFTDPKHCLNLHYNTFIPIFHWSRTNWSWKYLLLVRFEILGLFGNTFTEDHLYCRHRCEKLPQEVETQLSRKRRIFSRIFITFSGSRQNFAPLENKDHLHSLNNLEVIEPNKCGYFNGRKLLF